MADNYYLARPTVIGVTTENNNVLYIVFVEYVINLFFQTFLENVNAKTIL